MGGFFIPRFFALRQWIGFDELAITLREGQTNADNKLQFASAARDEIGLVNIARKGNPMIRYSLALVLLSLPASGQVILHPGDNIPAIVRSKPEGTTFVFPPGTYRLSQPIHPKNNDQFVGQTKCDPPASSCPAIISGATEIGSLARSENGKYAVMKQRQQNPRGDAKNDCERAWQACMYPEDLYFDNVPLHHLDSPTLPNLGPGEWWFDYANHVIYFYDDPSGHRVETSVLNNGFGGPANSVTIKYLTVEKFADMYPVGSIGETQGVNALTQQTDWTIEHCEVRLNHGFGVRVNYRMRILNNYIHDNGETGVGGGIGVEKNPATQSTFSGVLIQGNAITHNDYAHFDPVFGSGGVKIGTTSGVTIRGNTIENNEGSGIHFDEDSGSELVDGNTLINNSDGDGLVQEIGAGLSTFRNNKLIHNGAQLNEDNHGFQLAVRVSSGVESYCNVLEVGAGNGTAAWGVGTSRRGTSPFPPFHYRTSSGNSFHHNTIIWDEGANGDAGFRHNDPDNQSGFFANNTPPDYNEYHLPKVADATFVYDNNNSRTNEMKTFRRYQASGADIHGTADANVRSGWPEVTITSPADQTSVNRSVTISATASDRSGIGKVEFYVDWKLQKTLTSTPYNFSWTNATRGSHIVTAMAYSNAGIRNCYAVTLNAQ
jgi:parallel beta-helix repeat protein